MPSMEEDFHTLHRRHMTPQEVRQFKRQRLHQRLVRRSGYIAVALLYAAMAATCVWWVFAIR